MTTRNLLITALVGTGLVGSTAVWATEEMSEAVDMNALPQAVQKTIKDKAAGGEIVGVKREDEERQVELRGHRQKGRERMVRRSRSRWQIR
jgi:hypothetical protein